MKRVLFVSALLAAALSAPAFAQTTQVVGEVVTSRNFTGPNDTIGVLRFEDPKVPGAFCYFSSANKGGFSANFGLQEDRAEFVLDCFIKGAVSVPDQLPDKAVISERSRSVLFKKLYVEH